MFTCSHVHLFTCSHVHMVACSSGAGVEAGGRSLWRRSSTGCWTRARTSPVSAASPSSCIPNTASTCRSARRSSCSSGPPFPSCPVLYSYTVFLCTCPLVLRSLNAARCASCCSLQERAALQKLIPLERLLLKLNQEMLPLLHKLGRYIKRINKLCVSDASHS